ncbi:solute carrier organic anion transporter family member 6A1 isoform X3 [Panthera leo]|uniref:solute carrier organic anion transporter family member 6A1 isoform X3 n=1 Tax=Panthera leo TaxID=9689 RepID=UPI001C6973F2|nr:solute carrier organic anion transporter family member 6A1 isoform X3 [Panthera leo]
MQDARVDMGPQASPAQISEDTLAEEAGNATKRTLPSGDGLIKFHGFPQQGNDQAVARPALRKKTREGKESLERPCGLGCIVIPSCQRFNNIQCFLVFFCILVVSQGIVFGLVDLSIDTFQKENHLGTSENLVLSLTYDISSCLIVLFISHYGGRGNIPRWIAFSSFLVGLGSLFFAFPYISDGRYQLSADPEDTCQEMKIIKTCRKVSPSFQAKYIASFILGQTVQGIAGMPLYILGRVFIDNSVATHSAGIYLGLMDASLILGYSLAYVIGAPLMKGAENNTFPISVEDIDDHHKWLRSWWIYFGFVSLTAWITLIPLSCFPHSVGGTAKIKAEKRKQLHPFDNKFKDKELGTSIKDLFANTWVLMKNPVFICLALTKASESLVLIGASEFLPIYIENQFVLTRTTATKIAGLVLLPGGALGKLLGGCIQSKIIQDHKAYYNCSCIQEGLTTADDQGDFIDARPGTCDAKCYKLPLFIAFIFSTILFSVFSGVPNTLAILRFYHKNKGKLLKDPTGDSEVIKVSQIVSDNQRSLALGLALVFLRIFGTIPGPIVFKMTADISCIFRETEYCGDKGNCWIYNKMKMAYLLVGICCICKVVTIFFTAIAFCLCKYLPKDNSEILHMPVKNPTVKKKRKN